MASRSRSSRREEEKDKPRTITLGDFLKISGIFEDEKQAQFQNEEDKKISHLKSELQQRERNYNDLLKSVQDLKDRNEAHEYLNRWTPYLAANSFSASDIYEGSSETWKSFHNRVTSLKSGWGKSYFHEACKIPKIKREHEDKVEALKKKNEELKNRLKRLEREETVYLELLKSHGIDPDETSKQQLEQNLAATVASLDDWITKEDEKTEINSLGAAASHKPLKVQGNAARNVQAQRPMVPSWMLTDRKRGITE